MPKRILSIAILIALVAGVAGAIASVSPTRMAARIKTGNAPCSENGGLGYLWVSNFKDATIAQSILRRTG
jgi:hypothetical protein